ncbi:MAG: hypothetical protein Q8Q17_02650 [bacterium]|nr:hypothetical protein [bacterium]
MPIKTVQPKIDAYPILSIQERLLIWERVRGTWKNRKPNPIKELKQMRKEWENKVFVR